MRKELSLPVVEIRVHAICPGGASGGARAELGHVGSPSRKLLLHALSLPFSMQPSFSGACPMSGLWPLCPSRFKVSPPLAGRPTLCCYFQEVAVRMRPCLWDLPYGAGGYQSQDPGLAWPPS